MVKILAGCCLEILKTLPEKLVNCCVTSPPYWGLRDYQTAKWEGGDAACDHKEARCGLGESSSKQTTSNGASTYYQYRHICHKCGAHRVDQQIGIEQSPEEYVDKMVKVFREAKRVLIDDGTVWINLGDRYNGSGPSGGDGKQYTNVGSQATTIKKVNGIKPKDLAGIPWRVAFALQADGWYLRSEIIWHKPNPMPESVTDRPTKSHEQIFLLSKSPRYFYDAAAIAEPFADERMGNPGGGGNYVRELYPDNPHAQSGLRSGIWEKGKLADGRNRRSVWTVSTHGFPGAHFATFPPKLIEPCILAGCPVGGTVLDPFGGSGTTGLVAEQNGRNSILIELNPKYVEMAKRRTAQSGLFAGRPATPPTDKDIQ